MSDANVRAVAASGPNDRVAVIQPVEGVSLRSVERLLRRFGLRTTAARSRGEVYAQVEELATAEGALASAGLEFDQALHARLAQIRGEADRHGRARRVVADMQKPGTARRFLAAFDGLDLLDEHQVEAVATIVHPDVDGLCLFDEQGLGKTVTTLFAYRFLQRVGAVGKMLIFAPKSMVLEWINDALRFFGDSYRYQALVGSERQKRAACDMDADIYVTNFETSVRLASRLQQLLMRDYGKALLVIDESFYVKNAAALRTQSLRRLRDYAGKCVVLCGTPAPNSPHDLIEQFNIADRGYTFRGVSVPDDRDAARPIVAEAVEARGVYLRHLKHQVLALPGKSFHRVLVPLQPRQDAIYRRILLEHISALYEVDDVQFRKSITSFMARRSALLQTCSHPGAVVEGYDETPAKLVSLDSVLQELIERRREKVVLWSFYRHSLDTIYRRYAAYSPVRFDGSVTDAAVRRAGIKRFQEDDETMLFVANPAAAGAGITLHRARYAIYESMSNQAAHYLQSLDRIHRRGQQRDVEYIVLLCTATIEEQEYGRLLKKQTRAQELLGDDIAEPPTRDAMLREAIDAAKALGLCPPGYP